MNSRTILGTLFVFLFLVASFATAVTAAAPLYRVDKVEVDGTVMNDNNTIYVERGTSIPVRVDFTGFGNISYDARVEAYIGGYEYGKVSDITDIFQILPGVSDHKDLRLNVPYDLDASKDYTLNVQLFDDQSNLLKVYHLRVEEKRHNVATFDAILTPPQNVKSGQPLFVSVRVENLGDNTEQTAKVTAAIPELGVSASEFVDQLVTTSDLSDNADQLLLAKRQAATTNDLLLLVPQDAKEGDYNVKVQVSFNRGHDVTEKTFPIHVSAANKVAVGSGMVNVASSSQSTIAGQGTVYKVSVANLGSAAQTFSLAVAGVDGWGTSRVDPATLTVAQDSAGDFNLYVSPAESVTGTKTFTVSVKDASGAVVGEKVLTLDVQPASSSLSGETVKHALQVGFIALLAILVIIGLVLIIKRLTADEPEEPVQGKTYY